MRVVNRTAVIVMAREPYIEWANSFDSVEELSADDLAGTTYLLPEDYDVDAADAFIEENYLAIFEEELEAWMADPEDWPGDRTYELFLEWFDVIFCDGVYDFTPGAVEVERY